jgi:hypothetical protein
MNVRPLVTIVAVLVIVFLLLFSPFLTLPSTLAIILTILVARR